ncbi:uncharacterized protein J3D65DRAFT_602767 [Phyllosticta citribraziliensis]|uniref:Uncharacterized protein n=1 Tax=Phyllosticta citribraziliensis TaxID=989973 RepID=A0ABR1LUF6_9PEZI
MAFSSNCFSLAAGCWLLMQLDKERAYSRRPEVRGLSSRRVVVMVVRGMVGGVLVWDCGRRHCGTWDVRLTSLGPRSTARLFALVVFAAVSLSADVCRARNGSMAWSSWVPTR